MTPSTRHPSPFKLLLASSGSKITKLTLGCVVESLAGRVAKWQLLLGYFFPIKKGVHIKYGLFCRLQNCIKPTKYSHRQDDVSVFPSDVQITEHIISNTPNEVGDPAVLCSVHI